jgi:hypothetical protein
MIPAVPNTSYSYLDSPFGGGIVKFHLTAVAVAIKGINQNDDTLLSIHCFDFDPGTLKRKVIPRKDVTNRADYDAAMKLYWSKTKTE